jgi:phosphoribosylformimino-5-aminoimidazole carboxamide ribotide isomerase
MGTAAVLDRELRLRAVDALGEALVVAVDARGGIVATHGWQHESGRDVLDLAAELDEDGVASDANYYTDVARVGKWTRTGAAPKGQPKSPHSSTVASGGVRDRTSLALSNIPGVRMSPSCTALYRCVTLY